MGRSLVPAVRRASCTAVLGAALAAAAAGGEDPHLALARTRLDDARTLLAAGKASDALLKFRDAWLNGLRWSPKPPTDPERMTLEARLKGELTAGAGHWMLLLDHEQPDVRRWAAWALGRAGDKRHLPALEARYREEPDPAVRVELVRSLSSGEHIESLATLESALDDRDPDVRAAALEGVTALRSPRLIALARRMLSDPQLEVRLAAAAALARHIEEAYPRDAPPAPGGAAEAAAPELLEGLKTALADGDARVRLAAARAAAHMSRALANGRASGPAEVLVAAQIDALFAAPNAQTVQVRSALVEGIARFDTAEAAQAMVRALQDPEDAVAAAAAAALGRMAPSQPEVVPFLIKMLKATDGTPSSDPRRSAAAAALAPLAEDPDVEAALLTVLTPDVAPAVARAALDALVRAERHSMLGAVQRLAQVLDPRHKEQRALRIAAIEAAARLGDRVPVRLLLQDLEHVDSAIQLDAAEALLRLGLPQGIPLLIRLLDHDETQLRERAFGALAPVEVESSDGFGYRPDLPRRECRGSILRWLRWWQEVKSCLRLPPRRDAEAG